MSPMVWLLVLASATIPWIVAGVLNIQIRLLELRKLRLQIEMAERKRYRLTVVTPSISEDHVSESDIDQPTRHLTDKEGGPPS